MRKLVPLAMIPLLILPNFLFLVPLVPAAAARPSQPNGRPLSPGTVTARNTWNQTLTCPVSAASSRPLEPLSSWNTTLSIPTLLFMGKPQESYIRQSFSLSSNGTFLVSDDYGNSYSFTVPIAASGLSTTTLVGNSTTAVFETRVTAALVPLADVKLTFSVYDQFCQPAGVRLAISGMEDWGLGETGLVNIAFDKAPVSTSTYRAYFGNVSGVALGFDWSDSRALSPVFDNGTSTLRYSVGQTFSIDPETVGSSQQRLATTTSTQRKVAFANGRWWVFWYSQGSQNQFDYASSTDGITWSPVTSFVSGVNVAPSIWVSGDTVYYAGNDGTNYDKWFIWRFGTLNANGSITWSIPETEVPTAYAPRQDYASAGLTISYDGANVWVAFTPYVYPNYYYLVMKYSGGSWATVLFAEDNYALYFGPIILPINSGVMFVYPNPSNGDVSFSSSTDGGSTWSMPVSSTVYLSGSDTSLSAVAVGNTVYVAAGRPSGTNVVNFLSYSAGAPSTSSVATLVSGLAHVPDVAISADSSGDLMLFYDQPAEEYFMSSRDGGLTWTAPVVIGTDSLPITADSSGPVMTSQYHFSNLAATIWTAGTSAPYNIRFVALPVAIPDAAVSSDPWSRPGLSPYESYFSEFSDFVSPGNGLVSVEVGTLSLPGRGMDFSPSLVYSEPYAFRESGSPYLYDNYTGSSLGYGWSLNLPWMGANYLHLSDGQAFPYNWSGNTYQYNGVTNFALTKNTGGTYTLNMSSGTLYRFDTSERLTSITDSTGNNTITFSYGANGYVSEVTDTVGRVTTFSYNSNNQLASISEGGRNWTLDYTGSQLTSLTDPLLRVTAFQYNGTSGAGSWLLTSVDWPTGGKVTYAYGSVPVGTEVSAYYATSRNVYYDPTQLSESQSISYTIVNGQVTWSNSTISDGTTIRSYLDYSFQPADGVMKVYAYDGSGVLQQVTETDSDPAGRTNATKIYSPGGALLAESTSAYDNWGNLIYTKSAVGQQEWYSYANTNSSGSLGNSGCTSNFYSQTISSNIHDLLLGSCDYQNGPGTAEQETFYDYGHSGNLLQEKVAHSGGWLYTDYTYDQYGNVLSTTNPDNVTTYSQHSSAYDSAYLTKTWTPDGGQNVTTTYTYNFTTGDQLSKTDPNGYTTSYTYDALGRQTSVTYPAVNGVAATAYTYYYDGNSTMKTVDPDGHVTKMYFDGLARETEVQQWNGSSAYSTVYYTYNWLDQVATKTTATGHTYTYSYDWNGRLINLTNPDGTHVLTTYNDTTNTKSVTDENGHLTVYQYNWGGLLTSVKEYNSTSTYYLTTYTYDLSGNMRSSTDAKGQVTAYQYNDLNRLVKTTFPDGTYEAETYDGVGNLLTRTTANGSTISYAYDSLNRLAQVSYPGSGGNVNYTYDANGNRLSQVSPSAKDYYAYDARGQLTNQTEYVDGQKLQTLYAYDGAGNVVQMTYPDGYALTMGYNGVGYLASVGHFANITYTLDGQISKISYGNGEVQTYTYDSRDMPTQVKDAYGNTVLMDLNYTYDGTGNVLSENSQSYGYDALNRLNYTSGPWGTITYTYDSVGNRVQMVNGSAITDYSYAPFNRLMSAGSVNYTYDANGNTVTKSGGWSYSYDYENRLTSVSHNGAVVQQNYYDGDGNRVMQVAGNTSVVYSYQGINILYQKNLTSDTVTKSFYAGGIQVAQMVNYTTYYLHLDALGSTRLVMPASMVSSFSSNYMPYGMNYAMMGEEAFQYIGKLMDEATGLYYEGARYYDPATGRFITEDSVVGSTSDPQSLNRYVYARDNPMKIVDMNGHEWWDPVADISAAVTTVAGEATNVASAVSNAWNSLPPTDQAIVVAAVATTVVVAATILTAGAATPVAAEVIGTEAADIAATEGAAEAAATAITASEAASATAEASSTLLSTATQIAVQAGEGAATNVGVTAVGDAIQGRAPTLNQLASSAAVGALSGGLAEGFSTPIIGLSGSFARSAAAYVGAGTVGVLADAAIRDAVPASAGESAATSTANGIIDAGLANAGAQSYNPIIDYGFGILSRLGFF